MPHADRERPAAPAARSTDLPGAIPLLDGLPAGPRERLVALMSRVELDPGVTFMHEGEITKSLTIIIRGRVALRLRVPERGAVTILTLDQGDLVGWSAVVPPFRATTSATTLESTELATFDAEALRALLAADAELASAFLPPVLQAVAARVAATRDQLLDLFRGAAMDPW
jgi:CRP-like cAMP-binding protein